MILTKTEIAAKQIDTAIDLFLTDKDFISALTIAGAGEEILGTLLKRSGKKNMLTKLHKYHENISGIDYKTFCRNENYARNALKHATDPDEDEIEIGKGETIFMIMRCMFNYEELTGETTDKMIEMAKWLRIKNNLEALWK